MFIIQGPANIRISLRLEKPHYGTIYQESNLVQGERMALNTNSSKQQHSISDADKEKTRTKLQIKKCSNYH